MSRYGHYNLQYDGNKIDFPKASFTISGISHYQNNLTDINYDSVLSMKTEPQNKYDPTAISIIYNNKSIGYVPNDTYFKTLCINNIGDNLKIINIKKINGIFGIRVIPNNVYTYDENLEKKILFGN